MSGENKSASVKMVGRITNYRVKFESRGAYQVFDISIYTEFENGKEKIHKIQINDMNIRNL